MRRRGFTLVELLVAIAIILVMVTLASVAASAARTSAKIAATRTLVSQLANILAQQMRTYDTMAVAPPASFPSGITTHAAYRVWYIRRNLLSADMPNDWFDVQASFNQDQLWTAPSPGSATRFPLTSTQRAYRAWYASRTASPPTATWAEAECLFLIVMVGGIADCLACEGMRTSMIGDTDSDGAPEFLDAWGNPIGFVLLPVGLTLPPQASQGFFAAALQPSAPTLGVRPLVFSWGPDGKPAIRVPTQSLSKGVACGDPNDSDVKIYGSWQPGLTPDDITNFDLEAKP